MTEKEKLDKLVAEIERRYRECNGATPATEYQELLDFIDSMQEECNITGVKSKEATGRLKECIDNVSEEGLEEARKQLEELTKECIYSKDNYTDEDRKVLCDGCEEECKYGKLNTMLDDALSKETKESWNKRLDEDSESEGIKEAYKSYTDSRLVLLRPDIADMSCDRDTKMSFDVFDGSELEAAFYEGAKWQKTKDQSIIELAEDHAMLAGMEKMKEQMMKEAVDGTVFTQLEDGEIMVRSHYFKSEKFNYLDEVKLIIIK